MDKVEVYVWMCIYIHIYTVYICVYMYVYTHPYMYIHICMCVYIYIIEYCSAIKSNEMLPFVAAKMDIEGIMLSEISQRKTATV